MVVIVRPLMRHDRIGVHRHEAGDIVPSFEQRTMVVHEGLSEFARYSSVECSFMCMALSASMRSTPPRAARYASSQTKTSMGMLAVFCTEIFGSVMPILTGANFRFPIECRIVRRVWPRRAILSTG